MISVIRSDIIKSFATTFGTIQFEPSIAVSAVPIRCVVLLAENIHLVATVVFQVVPVETLDARSTQAVSKAVLNFRICSYLCNNAFVICECVSAVASCTSLSLEIELITQIINFLAFLVA